MWEGVNIYYQGKDAYYNVNGIYLKGHIGVLRPFRTAREAFAVLIDKLNGVGYWHSNPLGYAYDFELVK